MKFLSTVLSFFFVFSINAGATTWYVTVNGNDANDGKSLAKSFLTLQKAADVVEPGDEVLIGSGIYTNDQKASDSAVLRIDKSGAPKAWITWKALPGQKPVIEPHGWAGILITGSYHIIDGITVTGNNDVLILVNAQEDAKKPVPDPTYNTNGIFINGRLKEAGDKPHHIVIKNCEVGKCPGGGIVAIQTDYVTIEDCKVYQNAWYMRYGGSGISTLNNWAFDDAPGYHVIIRRNYVWDNKTLVSWEKIGKLSDGNGIILDVTNRDNEGPSNPDGDKATNTAATPAPAAAPQKAARPEWNARALVTNNVSAFNGGSGIHTFRTRNVDVINNTTYQNGQIVGYPEIFANNSQDVTFMNNIMVPRPGGKVTSNNKNTNIHWDYNLYPQQQDVMKGKNDIVADPEFIDVELNPLKGNFRLLKGSKGINSGTADVAQPTDIIGKKRPVGNGRDRGAFEQ